MSVTEHGNVSSHFQFEKAALAAGLKAIFGLEAYCGAVDPEHRSQYKNHLTIIAENLDGYRNLNSIVTESFGEHHHYHPTVSGVSLSARRDGLYILSGCSGSLLACALLGGKGTPEHNDDPDLLAASYVIEDFDRVFGDHYFLEVQPFYELERTCAMNVSYAKLSRKYRVPLVVTHDVHYPKMEDADMQAILHATMRKSQSFDDQIRAWNYKVPMTLPSSDKDLALRLMKTGLTKREAWGAIETSAEIAELCNVTLPKAERLRYPIQPGDLDPWT
jgi:DNA polymerase-3 subunit alpha